MRGIDDLPKIELVDNGSEVADYLTQDLKERFIRILVTASMSGKFDENYFFDPFIVNNFRFNVY